jgi:DUF1016 N-terminal domain
MSKQPSQNPLFQEIRQMIDAAKQRAAIAVNAEITLLYWQVGQRIQTEILQGQRAEYGKQVIQTLSQQLTQTYGRGWSEKQLRHCLQFAESFPDEQIVYALRRQLSWTHLRSLIYIDDPLKRDFYIEMVRLEHWSSRQLRDRISSMLYERTALSHKPEDTIRHDLGQTPSCDRRRPPPHLAQLRLQHILRPHQTIEVLSTQ